MNICPADCPNKHGGECDASMCMPKPIEVLSDADLERGASPHLHVAGDEPQSNGGW